MVVQICCSFLTQHRDSQDCVGIKFEFHRLGPFQLQLTMVIEYRLELGKLAAEFRLIFSNLDLKVQTVTVGYHSSREPV